MNYVREYSTLVTVGVLYWQIYAPLNIFILTYVCDLSNYKRFRLYFKILYTIIYL